MNTEQKGWREELYDLYYSHDICCGGDFHSTINHLRLPDIEALFDRTLQAQREELVMRVAAGLRPDSECTGDNYNRCDDHCGFNNGLEAAIALIKDTEPL